MENMDKMDKIDRKAMRKIILGKKGIQRHRIKLNVRDLPEMLNEEKED